MIDLAIPGLGPLRLQHLVLDFNGTLALDGTLLEGVGARIEEISRQLTVHVITGDTHGSARRELRQSSCRVLPLAVTGQAAAKRAFIEELGPASVAAVGNGRNDAKMLEAAGLAIAVIGGEGAAAEALAAADVVVHDIRDAFGLLLHPLRLVATLRA